MAEWSKRSTFIQCSWVQVRLSSTRVIVDVMKGIWPMKLLCTSHVVRRMPYKYAHIHTSCVAHRRDIICTHLKPPPVKNSSASHPNWCRCHLVNIYHWYFLNIEAAGARIFLSRWWDLKEVAGWCIQIKDVSRKISLYSEQVSCNKLWEAATICTRPLQVDLWLWKWCPSHVWRGLTLCQF